MRGGFVCVVCVCVWHGVVSCVCGVCCVECVFDLQCVWCECLICSVFVLCVCGVMWCVWSAVV